MRILVTGGAGYVGSHTVRLLCERGHDVVVLDNLVAGHRQAVHPDAKLVVGNLADADALGRLLRDGAEAVMHFAAYLDVGESVRDPLKYYRNNVVNTIILLEAMQACGVGRLVFSSSCATYGEHQTMPLREDMPTRPINPYGRTKLAMEWALQDSAAAWGLAATALRYFNAAGAAAGGSIGEDHRPEPHLIPRVLAVALGQLDHIGIFGRDYPTPDGTCIRDYVHVEDLAEAHLLALERTEPGVFSHYNLGTGQGTSVRQVIDACRAVTGHAIPVVDQPRRSGDPPCLMADPTLARERLGWQPKHTDITSIVDSAWRWHSAHPSGYAE
jgi:UDP-glucose-4-epimerase GalE